MGLETANFIDELVTTNPVGATDPKSQGDDHLRLIKSVLKGTFPGLAGSAFRLQTKSSNYPVVATDNMTMLLCTASLTLTLPAATSLGNKHMFFVMVKGATVAFARTGADTINGLTAFSLSFNQAAIVFCDGTSDYTVLVIGGGGGAGSTGDIKASMRANAEPGWIKAFGTIGSAASAATSRANADTEALFTLLWTDMDNTRAPVSGGRGASAAADFAANKTITIPDLRDCAIVGLGGALSGTNGARFGSNTNSAGVSVSGSTGGSLGVNTTSFAMDGPNLQTNAQAGVSEFMADEAHIHANVQSAGGTSGSLVVNAFGATGAFSIVQTSMSLNWFVKL